MTDRIPKFHLREIVPGIGVLYAGERTYTPSAFYKSNTRGDFVKTLVSDLGQEPVENPVLRNVQATITLENGWDIDVDWGNIPDTSPNYGHQLWKDDPFDEAPTHATVEVWHLASDIFLRFDIDNHGFELVLPEDLPEGNIESSISAADFPYLVEHVSNIVIPDEIFNLRGINEAEEAENYVPGMLGEDLPDEDF